MNGNAKKSLKALPVRRDPTKEDIIESIRQHYSELKGPYDGGMTEVQPGIFVVLESEQGMRR